MYVMYTCQYTLNQLDIPRLEKLELVQNKGEEENKHLQEEISRLVASLKDLDVKYNEKVRALELSLSSLKRWV